MLDMVYPNFSEPNHLRGPWSWDPPKNCGPSDQLLLRRPDPRAHHIRSPSGLLEAAQLPALRIARDSPAPRLLATPIQAACFCAPMRYREAELRIHECA